MGSGGGAAAPGDGRGRWGRCVGAVGAGEEREERGRKRAGGGAEGPPTVRGLPTARSARHLAAGEWFIDDQLLAIQRGMHAFVPAES